MPKFDHDTLAKELKEKLNRQQIVGFVWRMAVRVLPYLNQGGHFIAWGEKDRCRQVLAVLRAVDVSENFVMNFGIKDAPPPPLSPPPLSPPPLSPPPPPPPPPPILSPINSLSER